MAENKTQPTTFSAEDFIATVEDEQKKADALVLLNLMQKLSGKKPVMWGNSLIGFGKYHYKYESGREGDFFRVGFSPRKTAISIYIMAGFSRYEELLAKLGKHKIGKACLYVKRLSDIDMMVLEQLILESLDYMKERYPD